MTATVISYRPMGWGTQLDGEGQRHPRRHELPAVGRSTPTGHRILVGSWVTDNDEGTVWYPGSAAVPARPWTGFQVTVGHGPTITVHGLDPRDCAYRE